MKHFFISIFLFLPGVLSAQGNYGFEFDYAQFGYDSVSNYVEFYYSFDQATMSIVHTDSADFAKGILHVTIEDTTTGTQKINKDWSISHIITDSSSRNESLIGVIGFILEKGNYKCTVIGKDVDNPAKMRSIVEYVNVRPFLSLRESLSDVQLASNMIPGSTNTNSIFYKNTYEVMPIPMAVFGEKQPIIFYYIELYNLSNPKFTNNLRMDQIVYNSKGHVVEQKSKSITRTVNSRVEAGTVKAYKLPTDAYTLVISLVDSVADYGVSSSKKFYIINPSVVNTDTLGTQSNIVTGMFGVMSEEELDDFFQKSKYIASDAEVKKYEKLITVSGKSKFLTDFWKARDEDQSDDVNMTLSEYIERIKESNQKYSNIAKEGWKTDRGRIYLLYGEPSEIERHPNETQTRPYEIWYYNELEGGVRFIFGDLTGFNDYTLIHSTKRGELQDPQWQRRIVIR